MFGRRPWTEKEDAVIRNVYLPAPYHHRYAACTNLLPNRTKWAVFTRAMKLRDSLEAN